MRKIVLLICIAFVVVCYGYPCLILPLGSYSYAVETAGKEVECSYSFKFNGKVEIEQGEDLNTYYYKLHGNEIIVSEDKKFDEKSDMVLTISSLYNINIPGLIKVHNATNQVALWVTIGIGILAVCMVVTIPSKK